MSLTTRLGETELICWPHLATSSLEKPAVIHLWLIPRVCKRGSHKKWEHLAVTFPMKARWIAHIRLTGRQWWNRTAAHLNNLYCEQIAKWKCKWCCIDHIQKENPLLLQTALSNLKTEGSRIKCLLFVSSTSISAGLITFVQRRCSRQSKTTKIATGTRWQEDGTHTVQLKDTGWYIKLWRSRSIYFHERLQSELLWP